MKNKSISCWVGTMLESSLGQMQNVAIATLANVRYPSDIFSSADVYESDPAAPVVEVTADGLVHAPDTPGYGVAPHPAVLSRSAVRSASIE